MIWTLEPSFLDRGPLDVVVVAWAEPVGKSSAICSMSTCG